MNTGREVRGPPPVLLSSKSTLSQGTKSTFISLERAKGMDDLFQAMKEHVQRHHPRIVFPESTDCRILKAASQLSNESVITPIFIGNRKTIESRLKELELQLDELIAYDPTEYAAFDEMVTAFVKRRQGKVPLEEAHRQLLEPNYFGTMLVYMGKADGLVSGAVHSTAQTVQPALQIIKTRRDIQKVSGAFLMVKGKRKLLFADCAINIAPSAEDLAEIALLSAETAQLFGINPKVAMLSFSTKGSAKGPEVEKVVKATQLAKDRAPHLTVDGEFQFDAAYVPGISAIKAPNSVLKGEANVFIFPNIESGNIGYKMVQRLAGYEAIGPILQGLNQPMNDLSRGCSTEDVYKLGLITAMQGLTRKKVLAIISTNSE